MPKWLLPSPKRNGKHIIQTIHGFKLIIDPSVDKGVELSLYETGTYEKGILSVIKKKINPEGIFVDVGANIGLMSIFVSHNFPKAQIHSFEAHPITHQILLDNIRLNGCKNIQTHQIALGSSKGEVELYDNWEVNRGGASFKVKKGNQGGHIVASDLLDNILNVAVSLIKIDVEGAELEVLLGAKELIKNSSPALIIEISKDRDQLDETEAIYYFIKSFDMYDIFKLKGGKERVSRMVKIESIDQLPQHDNIICLPRA